MKIRFTMLLVSGAAAPFPRPTAGTKGRRGRTCFLINWPRSQTQKLSKRTPPFSIFSLSPRLHYFSSSGRTRHVPRTSYIILYSSYRRIWISNFSLFFSASLSSVHRSRCHRLPLAVCAHNTATHTGRIFERNIFYNPRVPRWPRRPHDGYRRTILREKTKSRGTVYFSWRIRKINRTEIRYARNQLRVGDDSVEPIFD